MFQLINISLAFGGQQVLDGITWTIKPNQRIGLVGPNGAGKTTLLRLISGQQRPDSGETAISGSMSVGYLEQDVQEAQSERTVLQEALHAFDDVLRLQEEEHRITHALGESDDHESEAYLKLLHRLEEVHAQLVAREAHLIQSKTEAVLTGLGFSPDDIHRPLRTFSGGWRMRVALARLLLRRPDFLLLDEPTNHLDIDSIDWLESYLKSYNGTVVIVSHDRYFLDRMVTTIAELVNGQVTEYPGNYTHYLTERIARRELQQAAYDNQQKQIAEMERFVERFRAKATKAKQAQSRIKMLEKLERIPPPPSDAAAIAFRFPEPPRSGRTVLELSRFSKTYDTPDGGLHVFQDAGPVTIERGAKIALIGRNGAGKSTLARIVNGTEPFDGTRTLGYNVSLTYFAQHQADSLNPTDTILQSLSSHARGQSETEIRSILGAFLFSGDDVFKKIGVLSGGEKSRVALARTLLVPANFLILDEPTNHLDIQSINVLIEALKQYSGTFVVVSHDRHFLDQVVNQVWRVEDGQIRQFVGNYTDYHWQIEHGTASRLAGGPAAMDTQPARSNGRPSSNGGGRKTKEQKRREAEERNRRYREGLAPSNTTTNDDPDALSQKQLRKLYQKLEGDIMAREAQQAKLEQLLADPDLYQDPARSQQTTTDYDLVRQQLQNLYAHWEQIAEQLAAVPQT
ncbi:MAG TPA: ABC-F family ATP-binding cassette domain-containing protein [Rhodothermales bacterium]|nr:ABC-F family ATP-binding cassette domain-containing protein [Rhodothermales bacterium]